MTERSGSITPEYVTLDLKILAWNIHGLSDKLGYPDFRSKLTSYDILFLSETWLYEDSDEKMFKIKGYVHENFARFKTQKNNQKSSGGIILYFRDALKKHVSVVKRVCDHFLVIKITDNPTTQFVIFAYIPPYDTPFKCVHCDNNFYEILYDLYIMFSNLGSVKICGDLNT